MFKKNFVVVVKSEGKILREDGEKVLLPFGTEYSLLFKNLSSKKAVVSISIDGTNVLDGDQLVVNPNSSVELERFIENNNVSIGNRFKFIEKTEKISNYRGDKIDDGIIRVEYWFEKEKPITIQTIHSTYYYHYPSPLRGWFGSSDCGISYNAKTQFDSNVTMCSTNSFNNISSVNEIKNINGEDGITVKGSVSKQQFTNVHVGELEEQSEVITLMLRGYNKENVIIEKPLFVVDKLICETCGTRSKSTVKFCPECGTSLI